MKLKKIITLLPLILTTFMFLYLKPVFADDDLTSGRKGVLTFLFINDYSATDGESEGFAADIVRNTDCDDDPDTTDKESFSDFKVSLTIENQGHPNYDDDKWPFNKTNHSVAVNNVKISAKKLGKRATKRLTPKLRWSGISGGGIVPKDGTLDLTITLLTKADKEIIYSRYIQKYLTKFGSSASIPSPYLRYKVKIKVKGKEIPFSNDVDTKLEFPLILGDVDNCTE